MLAAGTAHAACPSERAVYRLKGAPAYEVALIPARRHASQASQLYFRLKSPRRVWWFTFRAAQGYGGLTLWPVSDPTSASAAADGPRELETNDAEAPIGVHLMRRDFSVVEQAPQLGGTAPDVLFAPGLGAALWYRPEQISGDPAAGREWMPHGVFERAGCRDRPHPPAFP